MKPIWTARDKRRWLKRRANQLKLWLSYQLGLSHVLGLPRVLMIEPTNECNLHCPLCPTGAGTLKRPKGQMEFELYRNVLADLDGALERLMLYNYGEPFLHPRIYDMIAEARQAEIHTRISTNGLVFLHARHADDLIASRLNFLRVSVDGATADTYTMYRVGGQLDRILEGVRLLQQRKRELGQPRPAVELQFIAMRHNEHELPAMRQIAEDLGVRLRVKTVGLGDVGRDPARGRWLPAQPSLRRYERRDGQWKLAGSARGGLPCDQPWHRLVINWDGQVTACCYDRDGVWDFGSAADGLAVVWNGGRLQKFRQALKRSSPPALCRRCAARLWGASIEIGTK